MLADGTQAILAEGECEIDLARRELRVRGATVPLGTRAFEIIEVLAEARGELVTKSQLMDRVWPGAIVNDNALQVHISALRKALGGQRSILKTEAGCGYRLLGDWDPRHPTTSPMPEPGLPPQAPLREAAASNLPVITTQLVGRSTALQRLKDLVSAYRLVTLTGPGGIGKTVLAIEVARDLLPEFADGCWLVELASLSDPTLVPSAAASILGLNLVGETISSSRLAHAIGRRRLLLILDNCEHVIGAVAELVDTIVRLCPQTTLLATSREVIRVDGEYLYRVPPLDVPAQESLHGILDRSAVELFVARASAFDSDYSQDPDALPLIANICRRLDGIPLAIEFAAARTATFGVEQVASGLHDRFALLTNGRRTALPRHRTLRATLDWSYDLLSEPEQLLLSRLAVFPAGFTLDGAIAAAGVNELDGPAVIDGIAALIEKSLVVIDAFKGASRWRLLETIRTYARDKLVARNEANEAARRHAAYFRDLLASTVADFGSQVAANDLVLHGRELDNVRAALDWCFSPHGDASMGIELTAAYAPVWMNMSLVAECRERCERALCRLDAAQQPDARLRMRLEIGLGNALLHTLGPSEEARTVLTDALATADALGDLDAQARVLLVVSSVDVFRGEYARAQAAIERIGQIAHRIGDPHAAAVAERRMGITLMTLGRLANARRTLERVLQSTILPEPDRVSLWRSGDRSLARASLARVLWLQGFAERAHREAQLSWDEAKGAQHQLSICRVIYYSVGRIAPMTGDFVNAENAIAQLIELATGLSAPFWVTAGQFLRGKLLVERGEFAAGLAQLRQAFDVCEQTGWRLSYPEFKGAHALALAGIGQLDAANDAVSTAIAAAGGRDNGQQWYVPELLRIKAEILLRLSTDHSPQATDRLGEAAEMAREQGALTWELRIALSLARLGISQSRHHEAYRLLASAYARFTEGFDTADLRAARALLDGLS